MKKVKSALVLITALLCLIPWLGTVEEAQAAGPFFGTVEEVQAAGPIFTTPVVTGSGSTCAAAKADCQSKAITEAIAHCGSMGKAPHNVNLITVRPCYGIIWSKFDCRLEYECW